MAVANWTQCLTLRSMSSVIASGGAIPMFTAVSSASVICSRCAQHSAQSSQGWALA